jgi:hypothetical protein
MMSKATGTLVSKHFMYVISSCNDRGHHCHDRMVVGFTTTYPISAYHH